jgi:hypothetical protein
MKMEIIKGLLQSGKKGILNHNVIPLNLRKTYDGVEIFCKKISTGALCIITVPKDSEGHMTFRPAIEIAGEVISDKNLSEIIGLPEAASLRPSFLRFIFQLEYEHFEYSKEYSIVFSEDIGSYFATYIQHPEEVPE